MNILHLLNTHTLSVLVPEAGVEPARYCYHWCLRPTRLPIPPLGRVTNQRTYFEGAKVFNFQFKIQSHIKKLLHSNKNVISRRGKIIAKIILIWLRV